MTGPASSDAGEQTVELTGAVPVGERALFELATLVGYYSTLALQLRLFHVPAPAS
ncbi:hypothetical protein [Streptomyces phaeochromogenes]